MTVGRIPSVEGGIQPTIVDAKGDLIAAVAADSLNRLAVGSNDQVLVADSAATTGLAWKSYGAQVTAGKNAIINGGMDIWQRGTSFTTSGAYTADRWAEVNGVNSITYTRSTDVPSSLGFQYSISRAGTGANMVQRVEAANAAPLAGQTVTLSFYYKSTAGSDSLGYSIYHANSADNFAGVTQIGSNQTIATPSTSWTRVIYSFSVPAGGANGLAFYFFRGNTATSTTLITGIQVELGSTATPFSRAGGTIQGELDNCLRYYYLLQSGQSKFIGTGTYITATNVYVTVTLPVPMRTTATLDIVTGTGYYIANSAGGGADGLNTLTIDGLSNTVLSLYNNTQAAGTAGQGCVVNTQNSVFPYIAFSAEI